MKALVLIFSFLALPLFAHAQDLKACNQKGLSYLKQAIDERLTEGDLTESRYMVNDRNQVVGVYIWNKDGTAIYGEVCEQIDVEDGYMTASSWYYWVNEEYGDGKKSSDPTTWGENYWYYISQDEGQAAFKMISVEANGDIVVDFRVIGYGDTDDEINFRQETLRLVK